VTPSAILRAARDRVAREGGGGERALSATKQYPEGTTFRISSYVNGKRTPDWPEFSTTLYEDACRDLWAARANAKKAGGMTSWTYRLRVCRPKDVRVAEEVQRSIDLRRQGADEERRFAMRYLGALHPSHPFTVNDLILILKERVGLAPGGNYRGKTEVPK
jgi:hypothetical protein